MVLHSCMLSATQESNMAFSTDEARLQGYHDERRRALDTLHQIEVEGWTFHEVRGCQRMKDLTAEHAAGQRQLVATMDELIAAFERGDA